MRLTVLLIFITHCLCSIAQVSFRVIVPSQAVVQGESFQVQYILEGADKNAVVKPPEFRGFRIVTGPNIYSGTTNTTTGRSEVVNTVYTLLALKPGRYILPPASVVTDSKKLYSNTAVLEVITAPSSTVRPGDEQSTSIWYLQPGEDPYEKIKRNLFVKLSVNKKTCYPGESVLATFQLYSRLQSKSDIIKNPGLYGFTVYDMINLADKISAEERVNGQLFTVHTIRKVQLYPLQAGVFTIDPMMIKNTVEFSDRKDFKKTEQEITEGILNRQNVTKPAGDDVKVVETEVETPAIQITVKPLPEKNKPVSYTGAVGEFELNATTEKPVIAMNEEGYFTITISGQGNFIQTEAPEIRWPAGIEAFEPVITDNLDKTVTPLSGSRSFRFPFVCSKAGSYSIPAVSFSFFNTDSNKYEIVQSKPVSFIVSTDVKKTNRAETNKTSIRDASEKSVRRAGLIVICIVGAVLLYWILQKKKPENKTIPAPPLPSVDEILLPAKAALETDSPDFYNSLQKCLWSFVASYFNIDGSTTTKHHMKERLSAEGVAAESTEKLHHLLELCETALFTGATNEADKNQLLESVKGTLEEIISGKK